MPRLGWPRKDLEQSFDRSSQTLASVEFVKEMMEQDSPECPYEYVLGKEFLPDFAIVGNKKLLHMRVFQMWYLEAVELGLESVPVNYPANNIFATGVEFSKLTISFEDIQFLYRQKRLDVSQITLWCMSVVFS